MSKTCLGHFHEKGGELGLGLATATCKTTHATETITRKKKRHLAEMQMQISQLDEDQKDVSNLLEDLLTLRHHMPVGCWNLGTSMLANWHRI